MRLAEVLPQYLFERVRVTPAIARSLSDGPIVCWLHHALRFDENPALDAARALAVAHDRPLVVVQIVFENEPYANDRHHTFILEGALAFARAARAVGLDFRLHVERPGHRSAVLDALGATAGAIVTDDMPIAWWNQRYAELERTASCPVLVVDAACVVCPTLVGRAHTRAFAFRRATETWRRERIVRPWPTLPEARVDRTWAAPFDPVAIEVTPIHELVASCAIDHRVGPVGHTRGGLDEAERRWDTFRREKLVHYARSRNDVITPATSRLSAYLNHGHISPLRVAREAALIGGAGVEKYLDELVIWRELAYAFARFFADHDAPSAIPDWVKSTLDDHAHERPSVVEREMLAEARTGDKYWDAAQLSLVRHGELHNNARMTWGKQIIRWSPNAEQAFAVMMELNDRYSLDGRSPVGYSGVLWCLGQFDHPVPEATPSFGRLRGRVTTEQATLIEGERFAARIAPPAAARKLRIAVIGAGLAGLSAARTLIAHGHQAIVFEKSRGLGGRTATRRTDGRQWDHGAPAFDASEPWLQPLVAEWTRLGIVEPWHPSVTRAAEGSLTRVASPFANHVVASGGMSQLAHHIAQGLDVRPGTTIASIAESGSTLSLLVADSPRLGPFDGVIVAVPPAQAAALIEPLSPLAARVRHVDMAPRWVALAGFRGSTGASDLILVEDDVIDFASRVDTPAGSGWTIRATDAWSRTHLDDEPSSVAEALIARFLRATGFAPPVSVVGHRWRYAFAAQTALGETLLDDRAKLVIGGDWCHGFGVEAALRSGYAAAGRLLGWAHHPRENDASAPISGSTIEAPALQDAG